MSTPVTALVLRGVAVAAHPVPSIRPRVDATPRSGATPADTSPSHPIVSVEDIRDIAREKGYREGWDESHRLATAQAREDVLAQAQTLIAAAVEEARQAAHTQAVQHAEEAARKREGEQRARIEALTTALTTQITSRLDEVEDDMLALCTEVIVRLLGRAAVQPAAIQGCVVQALAQVRSRPLVSIALHGSDLKTLQALPDWDAWQSQHAPQVQWIASAEVSTGGCLIQSPDGSLDARLDTQLETFKHLLLESRASLHAQVEHHPQHLPIERSKP